MGACCEEEAWDCSVLDWSFEILLMYEVHYAQLLNRDFEGGLGGRGGGHFNLHPLEWGSNAITTKPQMLPELEQQQK